MRDLFARWTRGSDARRRRPGIGVEQARREALETLRARLAASTDLVAATGALAEADFNLIGKFIQVYCFSDLNARRIIDIVRFARTGNAEEFASSLNETDVLLHLKRCATPWIGPDHIGDGIRRAAATLDMHRVMRNSFAHWAMRRTDDGAGYVMLSMNAVEVKRRGQGPNAADEATWGLVLREHVLEEMEKLNGHGEYLARLAAHLHAHRDELRALHLGA